MKNNRSKKVITDDIRNNFFKMLDDFASSEPDQKRKKDSATSLIIERRAQIVELIEKGYAVEQIILGMAKINLEISASTLRSTLRTTNEAGNRIGNSKGKGVVRKTVKSASRSTKTPPGKLAEALTIDTQEELKGAAREIIAEADPEVQIVAQSDVVVSKVSLAVPDKPIDAPYRPFTEAQANEIHEEPKKRRGPVKIDADL